MQKKQINDKVIKPIPKLAQEDARPIAGEELFPQLYGTCYLAATTNTGKTTTIFKIIQERATRETTVAIFCSTAYEDEGYLYIQNYLDKKGISVLIFTEIMSEDSNDQLAGLMRMIAKEDQDRFTAKDEPTHTEPKKILLLEDEEKKERKPKPPKKRGPKFLIILDDISNELKRPSVAKLVKECRHYKAFVCIATQYYLDLSKMARQNIVYYLLFQGQSSEMLKLVYDDVRLHHPSFDMFKAAYKDATKNPHDFLYVDARNGKLRENFTHEINFTKTT